MAYLVVQPIQKTGDQVVLGGFGSFGAAAPKTSYIAPSPSELVMTSGKSVVAPPDDVQSWTMDAGVPDASIDYVESVGCPECYCPDCPAPELKTETTGIAWWWLLVAGAVGVGAGYYAAKKM